MPSNASIAEYLRTIVKVKRQMAEKMITELQDGRSYSQATIERLQARIEVYNEVLSELEDCEKLVSS